MIDSTPLSIVVDQRPAGAPQLIVEADARSQAQKTLHNALHKTGHTAGAVTFKGEDVLAGPEDGFDSLANGSKVEPRPRLVLASGPDVSDAKTGGGKGEVLPGIPLIGKQPEHRSFFSLHARKQFEPHLPFISLGRGKDKRPRSAVCGEDGVQPDSPEVASVRGAVSVIAEVRKRGATHRLPAAGALDRRGVDEQEIVVETGALLAKEGKEPANIRPRRLRRL